MVNWLISMIALLFMINQGNSKPNPCTTNTLKDAILDLHIRPKNILDHMSHVDCRNTVISSVLDLTSESLSSMKQYNDDELLGKLYVTQILLLEGIKSAERMDKFYTTEQSIGSLASAIHSLHPILSTQFLYDLNDKELACMYYSPMFCFWDPDFINSYDNPFDNTDGKNDFLAGVYSTHDNDKNDRRWKWKHCHYLRQPLLQTTRLIETYLDETFKRTCDIWQTFGNAGIIGMQSEHDNHNEDRIFNIECGILPPDQKMENCVWDNNFGEYSNTYDNLLDFECPNNGVIRSIHSEHDNDKNDRIFKFECCRVVKQKIDFTNLAGYWMRIPKCGGCVSDRFMFKRGVRNTNVDSITNEYSKSFTHSVTLGIHGEGTAFGIKIGSNLDYTFSYSTSSSVANTISNSLAKYAEESRSMDCPKLNFYQWVISGTEHFGKLEAEIDVFSESYRCTDSELPPQCPPEFCSDVECQECKDQFTVLKTIKTESRNAQGDDNWRTLNFDNANGVSKFQLDWNFIDGEYQDKIVFEIIDETVKSSLFDDYYVNPNIPISVYFSTSVLVPIGTHYFCKACAMQNTDKPGNTCWAIVPFYDHNRDCGCSSDLWIGQGLYYGGYRHSDANRCHGLGGAFSGQKFNHVNKAQPSVGVRLSAIKTP
eukprot:234982_1